MKLRNAVQQVSYVGIHPKIYWHGDIFPDASSLKNYSLRIKRQFGCYTISGRTTVK